MILILTSVWFVLGLVICDFMVLLGWLVVVILSFRTSGVVFELI